MTQTLENKITEQEHEGPFKLKLMSLYHPVPKGNYEEVIHLLEEAQKQNPNYTWSEAVQAWEAK